MVAAAASALVTAVAVLGGIGVLPTSSGTEPAFASTGATGSTLELAPAVTLSGSAGRSLPRRPGSRSTADVALPAASGTGRRVVFDMAAQRVWLVAADDRVRRTYLVSGSVTDNLDPGTYAVYSRSRHAWGIDDSGTMQYMVRFTRGERAAIGFHDIPVHRGEPVQTAAQLGTPQSHGCIRQLRRDARALWNFAPLGTKVVVLGT